MSLLVLALIIIAGVYLTEGNNIATDNIPTITLSDEQTKTMKIISDSVVMISTDNPEFETVNLENLERFEQIFEFNVKVGDEVVTFADIKMAILYRPIEEKVVWVMPQK